MHRQTLRAAEELGEVLEVSRLIGELTQGRLRGLGFGPDFEGFAWRRLSSKRC